MPTPIITQEKTMEHITVKGVRFSATDQSVIQIISEGAVVASYRNGREAKAHLAGLYMEACGMDFDAADNAALFAVARALRNTETMNCKGEEQ